MNRLLKSALVSCLVITTTFGENVRQEIPVFFRNDIDKIEPGYADNIRHLNTLDSLFNTLRSDSTLSLSNIELAGWASPPATSTYNVDLSHRRAINTMSWIQNNYGVDSQKFSITFNGVNYPLLSRLVTEKEYPFAQQVNNIIDIIPSSDKTDTRHLKLRHLHGGRVWRELTKNYFPQMRRTDVVITYTRPDPIPDITDVEEYSPRAFVQDTVAADTTPTIEEIPEITPHKYYWSVHTNMLYDVLAIPNLGFEAYLGKNFSVAANWWYAWWKSDTAHRYWRTYGGYLAGRWWFGKLAHEKPLTGHHLGLYGQVLLYDFEWGGTGYLSGIPGKNIFHRPTWSAGIEYGFALPISKHLNLDFTIGVGYLQTRYQKYIPADDEYLWQSSNKRSWIGPTKLEVSLVWLLGHGNVNQMRKGG